MGVMPRQRMAAINANTVARRVARQQFTSLPSPAIAADTKANQAISAHSSRVGCRTFAQLKPSPNSGVGPLARVGRGSFSRQQTSNPVHYA